MPSQTRSLQQEKRFSGIKLTRSRSFKTVIVNYDALYSVKLLREDEQFRRLNQSVIKTNSVRLLRIGPSKLGE